MRWSIVPISVGTHVVAAVFAFIIPLAADSALPVPAPLRAIYVAAKVVPPPVEAVLVAPPRADRSAAPTPGFAPADISVQRDSEPASTGGEVSPGPPSGSFPAATGALPAGIGTAVVSGPPPPPPVAIPSQPLPVGGAIRAPRKILDVTPAYPEMARAARVQGLVILEAVISQTGAVERVRVLRSQPLLDAAAVEAVRGWRYTPTLLNNVPVSVLITITLNFRLNE